MKCYKLNCFNDKLSQISEISNFSPKDDVYRRKVRDLADLRQGIIEAVELITLHMLINTWQELEYRLGICRATTGSHIEDVHKNLFELLCTLLKTYIS